MDNFLENMAICLLTLFVLRFVTVFHYKLKLLTTLVVVVLDAWSDSLPEDCLRSFAYRQQIHATNKY